MRSFYNGSLTWNDTSTTDETGSEVVNDGAVQIRHDHNVELVGVGHELHASVVNDHVLGLDHWVLLGDFSESSEEETVTFLHDVGLVDAGDLLSTMSESVVEGELIWFDDG